MPKMILIMIIIINIYQADKDGNGKIDFSEFSKLWLAIRGEHHLLICTATGIYTTIHKLNLFQSVTLMYVVLA